MKILYDHQTFTLQKYGGISRYYSELIKKFDDSENIKTETSLLLSNNHYIFDKKYVKHMHFLPNKDFRGKQRLLLLPNKINSIYQVNRKNFDIFHPTYYDPYFLSYLGDKPFVLTVYDMIHEKFRDQFPQNDMVLNWKELLVKKASKIIAISENTKKDLIETFNVADDKIKVIYLGSSMNFDEKIENTLELPQKYILFVGNRNSYKNFVRFVEAVSLIINEDQEISVICVGDGKFDDSENFLLNRLKVRDHFYQYDVDDHTLTEFYKRALVFVFPSLYEGFGIPILEAFACKCPLACSETSSLPEIAGDGSIYFNPYDKGSIYFAIKKIIYDEKLSSAIVKKGSNRLKHFSWEKTVKDTKEVYEIVLKKQLL